MKSTVIYFPSGVGQKKPGLKETVQFLYHRKPDANYIKTGPDLHLNLQRLYNTNVRISENFRINVGGDHSMAMATIAASQHRFGPSLKIIWFDAHGDINTRQTSPSGNYHGMPLAYLTGLDKEPHKFPYITGNLLPSNILYLGVRDLDDGEKKIIHNHKMKIIKSKEINENPDLVYDKILDFIGNNPVHISFDVDGIDPTEMPCTGTTAPKGVYMKAIRPILKKLMKRPNIVNLDIVEFNLGLGDNKDQQHLSLRNYDSLFGSYL